MTKVFLFLFLLMNFSSCLTAQQKERQANINSIFDKMELAGVDVTKPLLYGYFFYDKDKSKLEKFKDELLKEHYKLVRLDMTKRKDYILHMEKVEVHSRASLFEREQQLDKLSKTFQIAVYDGWDVGNADQTKPLVTSDDFAKSLDDKSAEELFVMGSNFYEEETNEKAIIVFQKCIDRNFKIDTCYFKQGVSYINLGQTKDGIEKLEKALEVNPKYFKACFNIAATCYDVQEYQKSIDYYQKAATIDPKNDSVYYGIAASQFVLEKFKEAETNCQKTLELNPNNYYAKRLLESIKKMK